MSRILRVSKVGYWLPVLFSSLICHVVSGHVIQYTSNLSSEKVSWIKDVVADVESVTGLDIQIREKRFLFWDPDPWLELRPELFADWKKDGYATISLENDIAAWLESTLGIYWLAPCEVERDVREMRIVPFMDWLESEQPADQKQYLRRHLLGADRGTDLRWSKLNGLYPQTNRSHFHYKVIRPEDFEAFPELFAKDEAGKAQRPPFPEANIYNDHPDLLEPQVVKRIADAAIEAFRNNPDLDDFSILPNDSYVFSHIPYEQAELRPDGYYSELLDYSNYVYDFSNRVAKRVESEFPDKLLLSGAYMCWLDVPDFSLHPNLTVNISDDRTQWYDPEYRERDLQLVEDWSQKGMSVYGFTDYIFGSGFLIPRSLETVVSETISTFYDLGARRYRAYCSPLWGYDAHTTWLAAKLSWDAGRDPEDLLEKFFDLYYGPAEAPMRSFFNLAEKVWMNQPGKGRWLRYWKDPHQVRLFTSRDIEEMEANLRKAEGLAEKASDKKYARRVHYTRDLFEVTKLLHRIVQLRWLISIGDFKGYEPDGGSVFEGLASESAMRAAIGELDKLENELLSEVARLVEGNPVHGNLRTIDWAFEDDPRPRALSRFQEPQNSETIFRGWTNFTKAWQLKILDTEDAYARLEGNKLIVQNVFRGFLYRSTEAKPGFNYHAKVPITGKVGPSSFIYVRLDFYDSDVRPIKRSKWDRLPPGEYTEPFVLGPIMEAPQETAFVRLYVRFFHQEDGDFLKIGPPELIKYESL